MSQLSKQALKVENNQSFPNNNAQLITPTALRTFNENMIDSNVNQAVYTADSASFDARINAITGSGGSVTTGSLLTTASFDNNTRNLTFTKGDSSTFAVNIPDASGSVLPSGVVSGSSQVSYPLLSNIPSGIVSGSSQLTGSFVTTNTTQTITGIKTFQQGPANTAGIQMFDTTKIQFAGFSTTRIGSSGGKSVLLEAIATDGANTIGITAGVSGSVIGGANTLTLQALGNQSGTEILLSAPRTRIIGNTTITGSLTHSLQEGFVLVGNSSGITTAVSTGSFGGGGTGNGFPFSGSAVITGSLSVSETVKSQVYMNPQTLSGFTVPTGNNAMLVGPVAISGSIVIEGTSKLIVLDQVTGSSTPLPSGLVSGSSQIDYPLISNIPAGIVSGSSQLTSSYDLRYALSGSGTTINTGSFATTGSNTFIGNQTITGSLFLSSSNAIRIVVPNFPGAPAPGGVSITGSVAVNGNFALDGGNFFAGQLNTGKIVGTGGAYAVPGGLAIVSDVLIYNDSNINIPRTLGVSGSVFVSQSLYTGELYIKSGSGLPTSTGSAILTWDATSGQVKQSPFSTILSASVSSGEFWSTTTQSGSAGVSGSVSFNNSGSVYNTSVVNGTQLTIANSGVYNIQFSAQIETSLGADTLWVWFKKNGNNIGASASKVVLANNTAQIMTVNILDESVGGDYYEIAYQNLNGHARILAETASGNIPAIPSVIATIFQIR